jgi:hypothetical protein
MAVARDISFESTFHNDLRRERRGIPRIGE